MCDLSADVSIVAADIARSWEWLYNSVHISGTDVEISLINDTLLGRY